MCRYVVQRTKYRALTDVPFYKALRGFQLCGQALFRCMSQLVKRMGAAGADTLLETPLLPCLVQAFGHASADVRKAVRHPLLVRSWRHFMRTASRHARTVRTCTMSLFSLCFCSIYVPLLGRRMMLMHDEE